MATRLISRQATNFGLLVHARRKFKEVIVAQGKTKQEK